MAARTDRAAPDGRSDALLRLLQVVLERAAAALQALPAEDRPPCASRRVQLLVNTQLVRDEGWLDETHGPHRLHLCQPPAQHRSGGQAGKLASVSQLEVHGSRRSPVMRAPRRLCGSSTEASGPTKPTAWWD